MGEFDENDVNIQHEDEAFDLNKHRLSQYGGRFSQCRNYEDKLIVLGIEESMSDMGYINN